jgi:hypothetical protein
MITPSVNAASRFIVVSAVILASTVARAETFLSDFATSLDGWRPQWHKESTTGTDGLVTHSTERGFNDGASLKFDMGDGLGDDGTLWIEKAFAVPAGVATPVSVSFQLFNLAQSDFNQFQVKSAIRPPPQARRGSRSAFASRGKHTAIIGSITSR